MLITHIIIALSSVCYATYAYFKPTKSKIYTASTLVALTLASGTYLVLSSHSPLLRACLTGLLYTVAVSVAIFSANKKLAEQKEN